LPFDIASDYINEMMQLEENVMQLEEDIRENGDLRRSARLRKTLEYLKVYHHQVSNFIKIDSNRTQVKYPLSSVLFYDHLDKNKLCLITSISSMLSLDHTTKLFINHNGKM